LNGSANNCVDTSSNGQQPQSAVVIDPSGGLETADTAIGTGIKTGQDKNQDGDAARRWTDPFTAARLRVGALILLPAALLFYLYLRVAATAPMNSDGANNALQAWDMLHGHLLLHGWVIGDATYYTFELPIFAVSEGMIGLGAETVRLGDAIVYFLVVSAATLLACRGDLGGYVRGRTAIVRCGIILTAMGVPLTVSTIMVMMNSPDHIGTCAILLGAFLLADLAGARSKKGRGKYLPVWLGVVLTLGQLGDATVLYVGAVSVLLISGYRMWRQRGVRNLDGAIALAAALSYPAELLIRLLCRVLGGYTMIPPQTGLAPIGQWWSNAVVTWHNLGVVYGIVPGVTVRNTHSELSTILGSLAALATVFGFVQVVRRWRTAGRGAQILCVAIVVNLVSYTVSTIPNLGNAREVVFVLPAGAVLAAWAARGPVLERRWVVVPVAAVLALTAFVPTALTAAGPPANSRQVVLGQWLKAHNLTYGIGGYWDSSAVSVESGDAVEVRAVWLYQGNFDGYSWEAKASWYDPAANDARFFITDPTDPVDEITPAEVEAVYGKPVAIYTVATRVILVYDKNLLEKVAPLQPGLG
jgi:hypothetical protein